MNLTRFFNSVLLFSECLDLGAICSFTECVCTVNGKSCTVELF